MNLLLGLVAVAVGAEPSASTDLPLPDVHPRRPPAERFHTTGFRTALVTGPAATARLAFVQDLDGPSIGELTLRGQMGWPSFGIAVETVATAGASSTWSSAGFGNTFLDLRGIFGRGSTHALGLRGTFGTGTRYGVLGPVGWWGTVPSATVPTWGVALAYEGATERWAWHVHTGLHTDAYWAFAYTAAVFDLGASVATVQPLSERWFLVGEAEVLSAASPVHLRALARRDLGRGWTVDAGVAVPLPAMFLDPSVQLLGTAQHRW